MKTLLWLDDYRDPNEIKDGVKHWLVFSPIPDPYALVWVKSYAEFTSYITEHGLPDGICFDHDLGLAVAIEARANGMSKRQARKLKPLELTGMDCAKWLVDYCIDNKKKLPLFNIQSANPVGKENIHKLLTNFLKSY